MNRYLNFYFNPFECPGSVFNFQSFHLLETDCVKVPTLKKPFMGGGIDDEPDYQNGIAAVTFDTRTTPPSLILEDFGLQFCAKFNHRQFPEFCIDGIGRLVRTRDYSVVIEGTET